MSPIIAENEEGINGPVIGGSFENEISTPTSPPTVNKRVNKSFESWGRGGGERTADRNRNDLIIERDSSNPLAFFYDDVRKSRRAPHFMFTVPRSVRKRGRIFMGGDSPVCK